MRGKRTATDRDGTPIVAGDTVSFDYTCWAGLSAHVTAIVKNVRKDGLITVDVNGTHPNDDIAYLDLRPARVKRR